MLGVRKCLGNKNRGGGSHAAPVWKSRPPPTFCSSAGLKKNTKAALSSTLTLVSRNLQSDQWLLTAEKVPTAGCGSTHPKSQHREQEGHNFVIRELDSVSKQAQVSTAIILQCKNTSMCMYGTHSKCSWRGSYPLSFMSRSSNIWMRETATS